MERNKALYIIIGILAIIGLIFVGYYDFINNSDSGEPFVSDVAPPDQKVENHEEQKAISPQKTMENQAKTIAFIKTNYGNITLELFYKDAPKTVENFIKLSQSGFYNGTKFHRVIKGFMVQGGDPNSKDDNWSDDGSGGPGYMFEDEINSHKIVRGVLAMANAGPNTNGSQFFIVTAAATPWLDGKHTVFGRILEGIDTVVKIENVATDKARGDRPIQDVTILGVEIK